MKEKVMITGGLGFIGHSISIALQKAGFDIVIVDNYSHNINQTWHKEIINQRLNIIEKAGIPIIEADTTDEEKIEEIVLNVNPDKMCYNLN